MTDFSQMSNEQLYQLANTGATDMAAQNNAAGGEGSNQTPNWALYAEAEGELRKRLGLPPMEGHNFGSNISGLWKAYQDQPTWFKLALAGTTAGAAGAFGGAGGAAPATGGTAAGAEGVTVGSYGGAAAAGAPTVAGTATGGGQFLTAAGVPLAAGSAAAPALASGTTAGGTFTPAAQGATTGAGTGAGTGLGTAATGTALSRIIDGSGSTADYTSVLGNVGQAALGMYASNQQTEAYKELANKYMAMGEPYRGKLAEISNDPNQFYNSAGAQQAMKSYNQSITPQTGNPAGSPYAQALGIEALYKQYGAERDRLAQYGGLSGFNAAAPGAASNVIGSQANTYNALGAGLGGIFNPPQQQNSLADLFRTYKSSGGTY